MANEQVQQAINEAKELIKMLETTSVRRISLAAGDFKILIERNFAEAGTAEVAQMLQPAGAEPPAAEAGLHQVTAPMVGTFYHAPSPGAKPFTQVGARVEKGQTIGIVEAMKVMNEVPSDVAGVVVEIVVADAQPVEFEQPLIVIDTKA